jgi:hypothetical protein
MQIRKSPALAPGFFFAFWELPWLFRKARSCQKSDGENPLNSVICERLSAVAILSSREFDGNLSQANFYFFRFPGLSKAL